MFDVLARAPGHIFLTFSRVNRSAKLGLLFHCKDVLKR